MNYQWPLSVPNFTLWDKLKFVRFLLTNDRWTQGDIVTKFEGEMSSFVGSKYAVFTSSGSTANTLLAMYLKDHNDSDKNIIVFPSTTWITAVSPFIREGFKPKFIDITFDDYSMNLDLLDNYLKKNNNKVRAVFVTSLIGFTPNIKRLKEIEEKYNVTIMMDNCENTLGKFGQSNVSSFFTSTTSTYFGHQIQSVEGGFIFTNSEREYHYFLKARNHGMIRSLPFDAQQVERNQDVDAKFDFNMLGNNFRNTNLNAFLGSLDLKRADKYYKNRRELYSFFAGQFYQYMKIPSERKDCLDAPFCLPIVLSKDVCIGISKVSKLCDDMGIETRPIISGNLLRQTALKKYGYYRQFPVSEYLHKNGIYIGLHGYTTKKDVIKFSDKLIYTLCYC